MPGSGQVPTLSSCQLPHVLTERWGLMGTHPPHGRSEALRQTPQAAQVPLEAAQLEGRGLGSTAPALQGLGRCRRLLAPPQARAHHKQQVTQEQLHGLGVVGSSHRSSSSGRGRLGAHGARGRLRAALPRHCTRLTHMQCNSNAPRGRPPL